jgi:hypothetical protein
MFTRTYAAARPRDTARRCTGPMPEAVPHSVPSAARRAVRRGIPDGSPSSDALRRRESGDPSPIAQAMPVLVACVTLLAMLYLYSGWHR